MCIIRDERQSIRKVETGRKSANYPTPPLVSLCFEPHKQNQAGFEN